MSRNQVLFPLKPLGSKYKRKPIISFDIETYHNNTKFIMASVTLPDGSFLRFRSKQSFIRELMNQKHRGHIWVATNLQFDILGLLYGTEYEGKIHLMERGGFIFGAKTYVYNNTLTRRKVDRDKGHKIEFTDTLAYYPNTSVEKLGDMIGIKKLPHPSCFNRIPRNDQEWEEMEKYCDNDALISRKALENAFDDFISRGIKPKMTIASTAMDNFKRNHLDTPLRRGTNDEIDFANKSYFGAMCCAYKRGLFNAHKEAKLLHYHDFNSMYVAVMKDAVLPHPNYMRNSFQDTQEYINKYEGCSDVDIEVPLNTKIPVLPVRLENGRVTEPTGNWREVYSHVLLRYAMSLGARIVKVYRSYYSTTTISPFKFVQSDYDLRIQFKKEGRSVEAETMKLLGNSLYGKFGEMGKKSSEVIHEDEITERELSEAIKVEKVGKYFFITKPQEDYKAHCIPLWASYITSLARIKIHTQMLLHDPYYVDTDSLICDHFIQDSDQLGDFKLEMIVEEAYFIRPKFYSCLPVGHNTMSEKELAKKIKLKIKGVPRRIVYTEERDQKEYLDIDDLENVRDRMSLYEDFKKIVGTGKEKGQVKYKKFTKMRESIRRKFQQNEMRLETKSLDLEDTKRVWSKPFDINGIQESEPIRLIDGKQFNIIKKHNNIHHFKGEIDA